MRHQLDRLFGLRPWQRHSLVLAVAGAVYVLVGLAYLTTPLTEDRQLALKVALSYGATIHWWGTVWVIIGLLALASTRWPPASKTWGYVALQGLATAWGMFYLLGVATGAPATGVTGALVWFLVGFMWWGIAGLVNPDDRPRVCRTDPDPSDKVR